MKNDCKSLFWSRANGVPKCTSPFLSVGDSAKNAFHSNPQNTVFDAKRLIGRKMDDKDVKHDLRHWPFRVKDKHGKPAITVAYKGEDRQFVSSFTCVGRLRVLTNYSVP